MSIISRVKAFQKELSYKHDFFWIADSALYTPDKLLACPAVKWISRVPENIKCCSELVKPQRINLNGRLEMADISG